MLSKIITSVAGASARRPKLTVALWLAFVAACLTSGMLIATKTLSNVDAAVGDSATAMRQLERAGLADRPTEAVLVRAPDGERALATATALRTKLARTPEVATVTPAGEAEGGRTLLLLASIRGELDDAVDGAEAVEKAVASVKKSNPGTTLLQSGAGSIQKALADVGASDMRKSEVSSIPIAAVILLIAFGAVVAASVPLLLGVTSVAAAMGALGLLSQITPISDPTGPLLVLIGLAVGVDYSLFYVRREREERQRGLGTNAAIAATTASVGRAIVVAGITVVVALAGLLISGMAVFASMALATMSVVVIAVIGSVTVLPATLALLGDRVNRGRIPVLGRIAFRVRTGAGPVARGIVAHPRAWLIVAVCVLGALALPVTQMTPASQGMAALPPELSAVKANKEIEKTFGRNAESGIIVVRGSSLRGQERALEVLGERAQAASRTSGGEVAVTVARDGRTASVAFPLVAGGAEAQKRVVQRIRDNVLAGYEANTPGISVVLGGTAASKVDYADKLNSVTPVVVGVILALAFLLLMAMFRSLRLAFGVIALNLLSIGAAFGVLTAVFQSDWAEGLLDFNSTGTVADFVPLMCFVVLFGLSMDYTILVLERIREGRAAGLSAREAAANGLSATGPAITSAAAVMVGVFAVFAFLRLPEMKQMGVGLASAIILDATIVRGLALPALVTLIGDRGWRVPIGRKAATWDDAGSVAVAGTSHR